MSDVEKSLQRCLHQDQNDVFFLVQENQFNTMEISFDKMKKIHLEHFFSKLK